MKILVTGGAGFIGSAVIRYVINNTSDSVINVDKLTYAGNLKNLESIVDSERYIFEQVDICNRTELERVFTQHQPDAVMHLAAESHVDRSIDGPATFIETNIIGTYTLLEVARYYWQSLDVKRKQEFCFHHVSTDEVYGDLPHPLEDAGAHQQLFSESTAYAPSSPYAASKASADHLVRAWMRTYGLPVIISNSSNNYGPYQFPEKLIPLTILNAIEGKALPVYGVGYQIRDWLYVDDHARALYKLITQGKRGETYNIGSRTEKMNIEVVQLICDILQEISLPRVNSEWIKNTSTPLVKEKAFHYRDLITHVQDRPGHDQRYAINADKIERELHWCPEESFTSGLRKTINWYLEHQQWCRDICLDNSSRKRQGLT